MKNSVKILSVFILFIAFSFMPVHDKKVVVLDAGHGGYDLGSQNQKIIEKDYTLEIANKIISANTNENIEFILLRNSDEFMELHSRVEKINEIKPDLVISLHLNKSTNEFLNGIEVFVSPENAEYEKSKNYADDLMKYFETSPLEKRGVKEQRFKIIRESQSPAMLFELGFVSNLTDKAYLESEKGKNEIVQNILAFTNNL